MSDTRGRGSAPRHQLAAAEQSRREGLGRPPPLSRPRRLSAAERREQLLDVAKQLVGERGLFSITIEAVASRAGVSRPIVYHHFGDLRGLLEALVAREGRHARSQLDAALPRASSGTDYRLALLAAWRTFLEAVAADPVTWRLVLLPPEGAPEVLREHIAWGRQTVIDHLARLVRPGLLAEAASPDPEITARVLVAVAEETARLVLTDPGRYPLARVLDHAVWLLSQVGGTPLALDDTAEGEAPPAAGA